MFFVFRFFRFYRVLILPKWLIKIPGPIAILFRLFLELRTLLLFMDPQWTRRPRVYHQNTSKHTRNHGNILENICSYLNFLELRKIKILDTTTHQHILIVCCFSFWDFPPNNLHLRSCLIQISEIRFGIFSNLRSFGKNPTT